MLSDQREQQENALLRIAANCTGCGRCVAACSCHALTLVSAGANGLGRKTATVVTQRCTGCGLCIPACPHYALHLIRP